MTERDRYFHYAVMSDYLRDAIKVGELGERDAEIVTAHLAETFRCPDLRHDLDIMPSARLWPWLVLALAIIVVPSAVIWGLRWWL